jgi:serine/threonine protein phosphatase PrpC
VVKQRNTVWVAAVWTYHEQEDNGMETMKKYLTELVQDDSLIKDFIERHEMEIKSFIVKLWQEQNQTPTDNRQDGDEVETKTDISPKMETSIEQNSGEFVANSPESQPETQSSHQSETQKTITEYPQSHINMQKFNSAPHLDKEKAELLAIEIKNLQITFRNGKVGDAYNVAFDVDSYRFRDISIAQIEFVGLEKIGLQYVPDEKQIKGTPTVAGDHKITMRFKIKGYEDRPPLERDVIFIINPDPKSLWKDIPTDKTIEYYKPDSDKAFLNTGIGKRDVARKDVVAASQRGRSHAIEGKSRDDDFRLSFDEASKWYIVAVADGAGSAEFSRHGSQIACVTAIDVCKTQLAAVGSSLEEQIKLYSETKTDRTGAYEFLHKVVGQAAFEAYRKICEEANTKQRKPKEYATTLLLTVCKKFDFGWFVGAFWVGDGSIGIYRQEPQELTVLGEADGGEFAGQTRFLTMPEIFHDRPRTRFEVVEDFTAVILMTDGVTDPKFETDANLHRIEKWHALWDDLNGNNNEHARVDFDDDNEHSAEQLLDWLNFWSKGNHDDRTIAILF